jgi:hypothetical protein
VSKQRGAFRYWLLAAGCWLLAIGKAKSEVEVNYKYEEIKIGYLIKTNTDKAMERKGEKANMQKYSINLLK